MTTIYLDNNASTKLDPRVLDQMLPALQHAGNASSAHSAGTHARRLVERARGWVAALADGPEADVMFTSGATEANNLAILGAANADRSERTHIITCATEHPAALEAALSLRGRSYRVSVLRVDREGIIDLDELRETIDEHTLLVSVMAANNETGVLAPLPAVAEIAHSYGALVHTDATQVMAWGPLPMSTIGVDMLSLSAHKFHGPQGVGALVAPRAIQRHLAPIVHGGGQERGLRSGTLNTAGVVGLGEAARLVLDEGPKAATLTRVRRDRLEAALRAELGNRDNVTGPVLNGHREYRVPGTLNIGYARFESDAIQAAVPTVAMSDGSACSTGVPGPSHVLAAMKVPADIASGSLRLSLSRFTTDDEVDQAARDVAAGVKTVRDRMTMVHS